MSADVGAARMVAELLAAMPDPAAEVELWKQLCREVGRDCWREGRRAGYEQAMRDMARSWREIAEPVSRGGIPNGELEERRWGPGGREHFADPRPGDWLPPIRQKAAS